MVRLIVSVRSHFGGNAATGEAAFAVRAASVLGVCWFVVVCGCLQLFIVVVVLWLWFAVVALFVGGVP